MENWLLPDSRNKLMRDMRNLAMDTLENDTYSLDSACIALMKASNSYAEKNYDATLCHIERANLLIDTFVKLVGSEISNNMLDDFEDLMGKL